MTVAVVLISFVVMEPVTYAVHRWVMHGFAMGWHRSHHQGRSLGPAGVDREAWFERNDYFPVVFAAIVMVAFAIGFNVAWAAPVVAVGVGVTCYGAAYAFVHDVYIHRRVPGFTWRAGWADHLADAHALHHRFGGEPYGMLLPVLPADLRSRVERDEPVTPQVS